MEFLFVQVTPREDAPTPTTGEAWFPHCRETPPTANGVPAIGPFCSRQLWGLGCLKVHTAPQLGFPAFAPPPRPGRFCLPSRWGCGLCADRLRLVFPPGEAPQASMVFPAPEPRLNLLHDLRGHGDCHSDARPGALPQTGHRAEAGRPGPHQRAAPRLFSDGLWLGLVEVPAWDSGRDLSSAGLDRSQEAQAKEGGRRGL